MLQSLALGLVITAILVVVSLNIMETLRTQEISNYITANGVTATCNSTSGVYTNCGSAVNTTDTTLQAIGGIPDWFAIIVIVIIGVVIFSLLRLFGASV